MAKCKCKRTDRACSYWTGSINCPSHAGGSSNKKCWRWCWKHIKHGEKIHANAERRK